MKITKLIVLGTVALSVAACRGEHTHGDGEAHHKSEKTHTQDNKEHVHDEEGLKLNHGNKWAANEATQIGMKNMSELIKEFNSTKDGDFKILGDSLEAQTNYIIHNCDMKGEPHNQLHYVLHPILDEVAALKESKKSASDLEKLLSDYFTHFEFKK